MYQTNLFVTYKENPNNFANPYEFLNVHPDNEYRIKDGMLSFETLTGDEIVYIPADSILYFHTTCERVANETD